MTRAKPMRVILEGELASRLNAACTLFGTKPDELITELFQAWLDAKTKPAPKPIPVVTPSPAMQSWALPPPMQPQTKAAIPEDGVFAVPRASLFGNAPAASDPNASHQSLGIIKL